MIDTMAIEIAIRSVSLKTKFCRQAIFVNESEVDGPLSEVRTICAKQDLEVPQDYTFLSRSGNLIPRAIEDTLNLREVATPGPKVNCTWPYKIEKPVTVKSETQDTVKSETPDSEDIHVNDGEDLNVKEKSVCVLELWIVAREDFPLLHLVACDHIDAHNKTGEQGAIGEKGHHPLCPMKALITPDRSTPWQNPRNLLKDVLLVAALFVLFLVVLVLIVQVIYGLFSSKTSPPEFDSVLSGMKSDSGSAGEMVNLRLQMSELELTWKFKFDQLNGQFKELEDHYLNDLAKHKREMFSFRNQRVDTGGNFATVEDLEALQTKVDEVSEYVNKHQRLEADTTQHEKKKGKKNERKEGL